ncbi:MAG: hypothetical protein AB8V21_10335 [Arsenophonus endosymbiont of Dermacentor nuttalli]
MVHKHRQEKRFDWHGRVSYLFLQVNRSFNSGLQITGNSTAILFSALSTD